ncbi:MAG: hypothetical protein ACR2H3_08965, partial [Acidimicrobiales bacterium]
SVTRQGQTRAAGPPPGSLLQPIRIRHRDHGCHTPSFIIENGVRFMPPNDLADLDRPSSGYTVLGAGKTSMDTCYWLLEQGVPADRIRWVRPRDPWILNRAAVLGGGNPLAVRVMLTRAAVVATDGRDLAARLEAEGVFQRLDPDVEPDVFRGATLSRSELAVLRSVENVVRLGKVRRIGLDTIQLDGGSLDTDPDQVHIDCTASGVAPNCRGPIFTPRVIDMNLTTFGIIPWSAALIGFAEARDVDDDDAKNELCPVIRLTGEVEQLPELLLATLRAQSVRMADPDLTMWMESLRLNPANGVMARLAEPEIQESMVQLMTAMEPALTNLEAIAGS